MAERRHQDLNLVLVSPLYERVHYALVMASAAAATGRAVRLFLTMGALKALARGGADRPGWHGLSAAPGQPLPADQDRALALRGVATFEELLQATAALGAEFMVCEMGLRAMGLARADLRPDIAVAEGGVVTFLAAAEGKGPILFV
jgi:peroxiredoxin family protein